MMMVIYTECGHGTVRDGYRVAHRFAPISSITPDLQRDVFDVLENPDPATLFDESTYDYETVSAAVNFVRAGIYDETLSIFGWDDLGMRHNKQDYPVKHIEEVMETKPHFAATLNGFWTATHDTNPNPSDSNTRHPVFNVPSTWRIVRVLTVNFNED